MMTLSLPSFKFPFFLSNSLTDSHNITQRVREIELATSVTVLSSSKNISFFKLSLLMFVCCWSLLFCHPQSTIGLLTPFLIGSNLWIFLFFPCIVFYTKEYRPSFFPISDFFPCQIFDIFKHNENAFHAF